MRYAARAMSRATRTRIRPALLPAAPCASAHTVVSARDSRCGLMRLECGNAHTRARHSLNLVTPSRGNAVSQSVGGKEFSSRCWHDSGSGNSLEYVGPQMKTSSDSELRARVVAEYPHLTTGLQAELVAFVQFQMYVVPLKVPNIGAWKKLEPASLGPDIVGWLPASRALCAAPHRSRGRAYTPARLQRSRMNPAATPGLSRFRHPCFEGESS